MQSADYVAGGVALMMLLGAGWVVNPPPDRQSYLLDILAVIRRLFFGIVVLVAPEVCGFEVSLKLKLFPTAEARLLEQELVNNGVKRDTLPSQAKATNLGYSCGRYDQKIARLIVLYDRLGRNEMARQWRLHLGHVFEFSLNFCEDVQYSERFKKAYRLYKEAGDNMRARRVAKKEAIRLRSLYGHGESVEVEDINGNRRWDYYHQKGDRSLLKEAKKWEQLATK